jgi:hypothetical protein
MDQEKKKIRRLTGAESSMEHEPAPDTPEVAPPAGEKHDPFDPQFLKKAYTQQQELNVKRKILRLPVHRPERHSFFRTHPDLEWWLEVGLLEFEREQYLVDPELFEFLEPCGASRRLLIPTITRQSAVLLWPIRLPGPDGRIDTWSQTALEIAQIAVESWVSIRPNHPLGCYDAIEAQVDIPSPEWPPENLGDLLRLAFKHRRIDSEAHPVVEKILGRA